MIFSSGELPKCSYRRHAPVGPVASLDEQRPPDHFGLAVRKHAECGHGRSGGEETLDEHEPAAPPAWLKINMPERFDLSF